MIGSIWRFLLAVPVAFLVFSWNGTSLGAETAEWPFWRGPNRDGISSESNWNPEALKDGPKTVWKRNVGKGHSSTVIKANRLYTMGNDGLEDVISCLNAETGEEIWKYSYGCDPGNYPGPRATPTLDGASVYTLSRDGHLFCLDARRGKVKWRRQLMSELKARPPKWGFAGSPWIEGRMLLLNAGAFGMAFDRRSGKTLWTSPRGVPGYASPVVFKIGKRSWAAMFGAKAFYLVDIRSGKKVWSCPWVTKHDVNAADPVVSGNCIFITSGYGTGGALIRIAGGRPEIAWETKNIAGHFSSPVILDGHIYGIDGQTGKRQGSVTCLDLETGKEAWSERIGYGSLMAADGKLLILTERGRLIVAKADPGSFQEISSCQALQVRRGDLCWTAPVLCNGLIYCRTTGGDLAVIDVRK